jgi:hypothetical protein
VQENDKKKKSPFPPPLSNGIWHLVGEQSSSSSQEIEEEKSSRRLRPCIVPLDNDDENR